MPYQEPEELRIFRLAMFGVVLLAAIVGNFMVIKAILGKRYKPFVYCLVTNLAVGEIISAICTIFTVTYIELRTWVFGDFLCHLIFPLQTTSVTVVTTTIAIISIRRYQVVTDIGMNFPSSKRGVRLVICGIWLFAFAVSAPLYIYHKVIHFDATNTHAAVAYCIERYPGDTAKSWFKDTSKRYSITRIFLCFVIQVVIMILSYGAVTVKIKKQVRSIIRNARARVDSTQSNTRVTDYNMDVHRTSSPPTIHQMVPLQEIISRAQEADQNTREKPEVKALLDQEGDLTRMFYIIVLIFIMFYLPFQIFYILELFKAVSPHWKYTFILRKFFLLLSCFPSALHPLCYGTMSRFYAMAFKKLVLCKC
ncbi:hypothetical protein QZH41_003342 [Actinostola sp. cb2023]|nr:hypothetical protein QZH41_003342 [Actinostola sp. cb2023]